MSTVRICPTCQEPNNPTRYACQRCGSSLFLAPLTAAALPPPAAAAPAPRRRRASSAGPAMVLCSACGSLNPSGHSACSGCGSVFHRAPPPAPPPPPARAPARRRRQAAAGPLACPRCGVAMEEGTAGMDNSLVQKVMLGVSWLELFFRPGGVSRPVSFLHPLEERTAAFCASCGGLWLDRDPPNP